MRFEGRTALITGGTRGIGAAIAEELAGEGAHVALGFRSARAEADELRSKLAAAGGSVSIHQGDIGVPGDCRRVVDEVLAARGQIDHLVNNAGMSSSESVRRMSVEEWDRVVQVNLSGTFYMTSLVIEHMLSRNAGRIVNVSSVIAETGTAGGANYAASKAGMVAFGKSLALEVAKRGITVNTVSPGYIDTEFLSFMEGQLLDGVLDHVPVGRLGRPHEVARAVSFLLDDEAGYITGATLAINGGLDM